MDIFAHGMWAGAAAFAANRRLKRPVRLRWAALWGMFPDLAAFTPAFLVASWTAAAARAPITNRFFFLGRGVRDLLPVFLRPEELYHVSHSLVFFALAFGLVWWLRKSPALAMLGWPLHILFDIPSHRAGRFGTPFLWPLTDYRFDGVSWGQRWFMILNWSLIGAAVLGLWLWNRASRRRAARSGATAEPHHVSR
jgi:hypothetical protein